MATNFLAQSSPFRHGKAWKHWPLWIWALALFAAGFGGTRAWAQNAPFDQPFVPDLTPISLPELLPRGDKDENGKRNEIELRLILRMSIRARDKHIENGL